MSLKCWEFKKCGQEGKCPAYPASGRTCWYVAGTYCAGEVQGEYAQKIENCNKCDFFISVKDETSILK
jgi:hypothetical protein